MEVIQDPQQNPANQQEQQNQPYDASFKGWIMQQAPAILPVLLPGTHYQKALNVEALRPPMRMDKVFQVRYHDEEHILHFEFEVGYDKELKSRLLVYNSILYRDHRLPVLTVVVYPFRVKMAKSPLSILCRKKPVLTFVFETFPLFKLNAKEMLKERHTCMYALLPTMKNVDADLMEQAVRELAEVYRYEKHILAEQFIWMRAFLDRTTTVKGIKKEQIRARLDMFEQLFEESPTIQNAVQRLAEKRLARERQEARQEGRQEGLLEAIQVLQRSLVNIIRVKYPDLTELAQLQATRIDKLDELDLLIQQVMDATDADAARKLILDAGAER
jgi:hypothetical protein